MNNLQLYLAIELPIFTIITSLIISPFQISGIREIRNDIKLLTGKVAEIDSRLSVIEERIK